MALIHRILSRKSSSIRDVHRLCVLSAEPEITCFSSRLFSADRVLQSHPLPAATQRDSPVRLRNERLQTSLCLSSKSPSGLLFSAKRRFKMKLWSECCVFFSLWGCRAVQLHLGLRGRKRQVSVWPRKGIHRPPRRYVSQGCFCHLSYVQFVSAVKAARRDGKHVFARKRRD